MKIDGARTTLLDAVTITAADADRATTEAQLQKLRQGLARLIDSYAEGLIEKSEFEPRIGRLRQRIGALEVQARELADAALLQSELRLGSGSSSGRWSSAWRSTAGRSRWSSGSAATWTRSMLRGIVCQIVGSVISPVLANLALDGLEQRLAAAFPRVRQHQA
jgi:hypothetical protein